MQFFNLTSSTSATPQEAQHDVSASLLSAPLITIITANKYQLSEEVPCDDGDVVPWLLGWPLKSQIFARQERELINGSPSPLRLRLRSKSKST